MSSKLSTQEYVRPGIICTGATSGIEGGSCLVRCLDLFHHGAVCAVLNLGIRHCYVSQSYFRSRLPSDVRTVLATKLVYWRSTSRIGHALCIHSKVLVQVVHDNIDLVSDLFPRGLSCAT